MSRRSILPACGLLAALLSLSGCGSSDTTPEPQPGDPTLPTFVPPPPLDDRVELDFDVDWSDVRELKGGERDYETAVWVTERRKAALEGLQEKRPRLTQAIEILVDVLDKVPDDSRDRRLLAECYFLAAAWWFKQADVVAWESLRLISERTLPRVTRDAPIVVLDDEAVEKLTSEYNVYLDKANSQVSTLADLALHEFARYRQQRPDDKIVFDYIWKLYFYLQNYRESLRWLEAVLYEMDLAEVPPQDILRQDYTAIRDSLRNELATMRIQGRAPARPASLITTLTQDSLGRGPDEEAGKGAGSAVRNPEAPTYRWR